MTGPDTAREEAAPAARLLGRWLHDWLLCAAIAAAVTISCLFWMLDHPYFGILDAPQQCHMAHNVRLLDARTHLFAPFLDNRARPGFILMLAPWWFSTDPAVHCWFQAIVLLAVPLAIVIQLVRRITGSLLPSVLVVLAMTSSPSVLGNYFVHGQAEPYLLLGMTLMLLAMWNRLECGAPAGRAARWAEGATAACAALLIYTTKEPGGAFLGLYVVGVLLLGWGAGLGFKAGFRRLLPLTAINMAGFIVLLVFYLRLGQTYTAGNQSAYTLDAASLARNTKRLLCYMIDTKIYTFAGVLAFVMASHVLAFVAGPAKEVERLRRVVAWGVFFLLGFAVMNSVLVPWRNFDARYFLAGNACASVSVALAIFAAFHVARFFGGISLRLLAGHLGALVLALLLVHAAYGYVVGAVSEGHVRQQFAASYDDLFSHVATHTPSNGTVYFMMETAWPEVAENTELSLLHLYGRPDINCVFPDSAEDFDAPGLIAVPRTEKLPMNYARMPVNTAGSVLFYEQVQVRAAGSPVL